MLKRVFAFLFSFLFFFPALSNASDTLKVYSAASMTNAINEVSAAFSAKTGIKVTPVYASSSSLARQIEKGAPADIYISANKKWVDYLISKDLFSSTDTKVIARNRLALITSVRSQIESFDIDNSDLWVKNLENSRLAIGQTNSVPAGIYGKQSLSNSGVWQQVERKLAPVNNVRVALALVEREEANLGIVYQTDAKISDRVTVLALFPEASHDPIVYPAAQLNQSEAAGAFYQFLSSDKASEIFAKFGFQGY
ncbi:molybdate ABC transporter substrate-binding protein [Vibrio sp. JC009]|uniref:molybdate ABC transporter substrate-binding protein n=1 Tax=Vibrio sp. JC009 TaxID=2912314 RepID=UPI0023B16535|nr:molybdate ABC transporter substrate-binding protein [Vibrio sp. JC009]WED24360.1 molybdate ABC transporter substrate-binding protein [Vibrio sp. JC009]